MDMDLGVASTVNPFAGTHPVAAAPAEMAAVRRATEIALRETPYYLERFGERGRLFGASDGGWLVALCRGDADFVDRQVLWLGRVLAARGVPRALLQRYLEILHGELARTGPELDTACRGLSDAAILLRRLRERRIPEADTRELASAFDAAADPDWVVRLPGMGRILVAAVADEVDGIPRAAESVREWAADPARFPERWTAAAEATLAAARERVRARR